MPINVSYEWKPVTKNNQSVFRKRCVLPNSVSLRELEWLSYESWKRGKRIEHYLSVKRQRQIGSAKYRVDGFLPPNLCFEFHGCTFHSHQLEDPFCPIPPLAGEQGLIRTREKIKYLKDRGYVVIEMYGCEWEKIRRNNPEVKKYLKTRFYPTNYRKTGNFLTAKNLCNAIINGDIFGLAKVDIKTPQHLREYFSLMQPLILNRIVKREDLGELMKTYCIENKQMSKPRKVLGQAFSAKNILLITPLLKWYINKGMTVTKIHWIRQYKSARVFQPLVDKAINYRILADKNPDMALQGTSWKLGKCTIRQYIPLYVVVINSFFSWKLILRKNVRVRTKLSRYKIGK